MARLCPAGGTENRVAAVENSRAAPQKIKSRITMHHSATPLRGEHPEDLEVGSSAGVRTVMSSTVRFLVATE